eukprot:gnl/MRDRNA2_/MRDRNA2_91861_c0_seq1.p1 gnl/MRDRNA2_/MRDRNA2_91861_c0~~gnl/MRDRNA2_/MRDRNA2_91861_c0_seq1.p1  ORF type:complete len:135 (+),score=15.48 gnl/MRDRNA2_/MRDRNA2_91861_c0_seq1:118-522(+)
MPPPVASANVCCLRCRNNPGIRERNLTKGILSSEHSNKYLPYLPYHQSTRSEVHHRLQSWGMHDTSTNHFAADASTKQSNISANQPNCVRDKLSNTTHRWQAALCSTEHHQAKDDKDNENDVLAVSLCSTHDKR